MLTYTVEKDEKTIGIFDNALDLLLFCYLHQGEFGFDDRGEDLYTKFRGGEPLENLNRYLKTVSIKQWDTGKDIYTSDAERNGKAVRDIAEKLPDISWTATMNDDKVYNVVAPLKPLAVEKAHTEHIFDTNTYSSVKKIAKL